jgi:hypothetical protein
MKKWLFVVGVSVLLLGEGCRKPEKPWQLPPPPAGQLLEANTGPEYDTVVFLRLETGQTHKALRNSWDLRFEPLSSGAYQVWLNAAMYAFSVQVTPTEWDTLSTLSPNWRWRCDIPDTAALPPLRPGDTLCFVVDRDRGEVFYRTPTQRYYKVRIRWLPSGLSIEAAPLGGNTPLQWSLTPQLTPIYLSLESPSPVQVAPPWSTDLIVTRYIHPFYDQPEEYRWYPVLGVLSGKGVEVATVSTQLSSYESFSYDQVAQLTFSSRQEAIGYDWKTYDFNTGTYRIDFSRFFVVKTGPTTYYKLRFIDFYDSQGRKGAVKIEYLPL